MQLNAVARRGTPWVKQHANPKAHDYSEGGLSVAIELPQVEYRNEFTGKPEDKQLESLTRIDSNS